MTDAGAFGAVIGYLAYIGLLVGLIPAWIGWRAYQRRKQRDSEL